MPVSLCIVGAPGLIGRRHTQHALDEPRIHLTCIIDPTQAGEGFASERKLKLFKSVENMLSARAAGLVQVDAAIVATPNSTHVPLGMLLVQSGIHVLVEKPFSTDVSNGRQLVAAAHASSAKILVGHHRRLNPYVLNCKRLINNGQLGRILAVQGTWATLKPSSYFEAPTEWRTIAGVGGPVLINLVHDVDLLRFFFGNIVRVFCEKGASARGFEVEETGACTLKFASGAVGTFVFSDATASPYNFESATGENPLMPQTGESVYTILGTQGSLSFPELKTWRYSDPAHSWTDKLVQDDPLAMDPTPPFTHQLRHFADVCEGVVEPMCGGEDALSTITTLEAILLSMQTGQPVDIAQG